MKSDGKNDVNIMFIQVLGVVQRDLQERTFQQVNDLKYLTINLCKISLYFSNQVKFDNVLNS